MQGPNSLARLWSPLPRDRVADESRRLAALAAAAVRHPPYDRDRLRAADRASHGAVLTAIAGAALVTIALIGHPEGVTGLLLRLACGATIGTSVLLALAARRLRDDPGLPDDLQPARVEEARRNLESLDEAGRPRAGVGADIGARATLTFDAAMLLYIALPAMLPEMNPLLTMSFVLLGALAIGRLTAEAVHHFALAVLAGRVRRRHEGLLQGGAADQLALAGRLKQAYGSAVGNDWPSGSGRAHAFTCYRSAWGWGAMIGAILFGLLGLRVLLGGADVSTLVMVGGVALAAVALAAAQTIRCVSLTDTINLERLILARFANADALSAYLARLGSEMRARVVGAQARLRRSAAPRQAADRILEVDLEADFEVELARPERAAAGGKPRRADGPMQSLTLVSGDPPTAHPPVREINAAAGVGDWRD